MAYRFSALFQTRHTDTFAGTPFVHVGVLFALTEMALVDYDAVVGAAAAEGVLRFSAHSEARFRSPLRWDEGAKVQMRCTRLRGNRIWFECTVGSATSGNAIADISHEYVYVDAASGRPRTPENIDELRSAIVAYEEPGSVEE